MTIDDSFKKDHYVRYFIGSTYQIGNPKTIGELRERLAEIIEDLPEEDHLKITNLEVSKEGITYILADEDSIITDTD